MDKILNHWTDALLRWLGVTLPVGDHWDRWIAVVLVVAGVLVFDYLCRLLTCWGVYPLVRRTKITWDDELFGTRVLNAACHVLSALLLMSVLSDLFDKESVPHHLVLRLTKVYVVVTAVRLFSALIHAIFRIMAAHPAWLGKPIKGLRQTAQGIGWLIATIWIVSILIDRSPAKLLTGLGASAAIIMLIFKDSILGFVSGIQLSSNNMLKVGDWISVPKFGADGVVEEVTLTTVKVRNWDNTITTLPPYMLISDSFQNWRAMQLSGGRRVMRSVAIDMTSVRFCDAEMLRRLRRIDLVREYIDRTEKEFHGINRAHHTISPRHKINGLYQTNLGIFRAYLLAYLKTSVPANRDMTIMVRQLQPTEIGIPIQLYFFTDTVDWVTYEGIQSDVFDHVLAVIPEFDLRVFQSPSGRDIESLRGVRSKTKHQHDLNDDHAQKHTDGVDRGV